MTKNSFLRTGTLIATCHLSVKELEQIEDKEMEQI
jgi:hypothetical protein